MASYHIAFWNLENLFDIEDSPRRNDKLKRSIGKSVHGWTEQILDKKISQLSSIISQLNDGSGPDILGMCEIENKYVVELLVSSLQHLGRNYDVVHHDTSDKRGIDVAFLYDKDLFTFEKLFDHVVMRRTATRDILQVNFTTKLSGDQQRLVVIGNHWPSRSGGQLESEGYRQIAGETLAYFHERILEVHGKDTPVIAMGDFNDEPFNKSVSKHALGLRSRQKVVNARSVPYFLNLMWPLMNENVGTLYFNNLPNMLDQFLVNENLLKENSPIRVLTDSIEINNFQEMTNDGDYPYPIRFGGMSKDVNPEGYSDHFPISVRVEEREQA